MTNEKLLFACAVLVALISYSKAIHFENYVHNNLLRYLPFFLLGVYRAEWLTGCSKLAHSRLLPVLCGVFVLAFLILRAQALPPAVQNVAVFFQAVLGVVLGAGLSAWACRFRAVKAVPAFLGKRTLPIYVAHSLLIGLVLWIGATLTDAVPGAELWGVPATAMVAILLSILLERLLARIHLGWAYRRPGWLSLPRVHS